MTMTTNISSENIAEVARIDPTLLNRLNLDTISVSDLVDWLATHGAAHLSAIERIELAERLTRRRFIIGTGGLALGMALPSCEMVDETDSPVSGATRMVETMYGPVELPTNPQRVLPGFYAVMDYILVLNLPLVARTDLGDRPVAAYQQTAYPNVFDDLPTVTTRPEINYEQIAALQPDCIIDIIAATDAERYQLLTAIAPTFAISPNEEVEGFSHGQANWRRMLRLIAQAFGREMEAADTIAAYETRATDLRTRLAARWADATFAMLEVRTDRLIILGSEAGHTHQILFADLGLRPATFLTSDHQPNVSLEALPDVDADVLIVALQPQPGTLERDRSALNAIETNPLWQQLPAVMQEQVYEFPFEIGYPTPLTAMAFLDVVEQMLLG